MVLHATLFAYGKLSSLNPQRVRNGGRWVYGHGTCSPFLVCMCFSATLFVITDFDTGNLSCKCHTLVTIYRLWEWLIIILLLYSLLPMMHNMPFAAARLQQSCSASTLAPPILVPIIDHRSYTTKVVVLLTIIIALWSPNYLCDLYL